MSEDDLEKQIRAKALIRLEELRDKMTRASEEYHIYLKEIQAECPHETILYHKSDNYWSDGYSRSSAQTYFCPACKLMTYMGPCGDWENTPLTRAKNHTSVSEAEMEKARGW